MAGARVELVRARRARGWGQLRTAVALAEMARSRGVEVNASRTSLKTMISRWENGAPMSEDYQRLYCAVFDLPASALGFLPSASSGVSDESVVVELANDVSVLLGLVGHRIPLVRGTAGGLGVAPLESMSLNRTADLLLRLFLHLDDELGGDALYVPLSHYVERMAGSVERDPADGLVGFGQLSQMAGWLALDANQQAAARRYFTSTVYVAHEADQPALAASALAYMSLQESYRGRPGPALSLAQTALDSAAGAMTPLTSTMLYTRLARAQACLGREAACRHALDDARRAFAGSNIDADEEPVWVSYVDAIELAAQEGACFLELGMIAEATRALTEAIRLLRDLAPQRVRDRVHYLTRLATCQLADEEIEEACHTASKALSLSSAIRSPRVVQRLAEFDQRLTAFAANSAVREFRAALRETTVAS